jgi:light-regulated signal transduction histidine kinase (bacteriophytochrome)
MVEEHYRMKILGHTAPVRFVFRLLTKKGATRWVEMNAITFDWEGDLATLNFLTDITEHKNVEEELRRSNTELQQFAYVASHDLQEPLRTVTGHLALLEKRLGDQLDEESKEYLKYAVDGGYRARELVRDLLEYSRVNSRAEPMKPTDMEGVLARVLENLKAQIRDDKAILTYDRLPCIVADDHQMGALLQNLLSNAIKFHGENSPEVHVSAKDRGKDWLFSVKDNGIGIDPKYRHKIFNIFQRLHTVDEYPGTGIGLAIANKIVERHGGKIWFESELGKGTTFFFTIPSEYYDGPDQETT